MPHRLRYGRIGLIFLQLTGMTFSVASFVMGSVISRTPLLYLALAFERSTDAGSVIER